MDTDLVKRETNLWHQKALSGAIQIENHLNKHPLVNHQDKIASRVDILNKKPDWLQTLGPVDVSTGDFVNKLDGDWLLADAHSSGSGEGSGDDYDSSDLSEEDRDHINGGGGISLYGTARHQISHQNSNFTVKANCGTDSAGYRLGKKAVVELNEKGEIIGEWDSLTTAASMLGISRSEVNDI